MPRHPQLQLGKQFIAFEVRENWELSRLNPELYSIAPVANLNCKTCDRNSLLVFKKDLEFTVFICPACQAAER